jgi:hypothetical protein
MLPAIGSAGCALDRVLTGDPRRDELGRLDRGLYSGNQRSVPGGWGMSFGGTWPRMARRLSAAGILAGGLLLSVAVRPAAACTWVQPSLDEVVGETPLIFVAKVVDQPAERSYVVEVVEVFRGDVPSSITFAHDPNSGVSSCEAGLEVGATYLFGTDSLDHGLGIGDVWLQIDGRKLSAYYITPPTGGASALYEVLRDLPDTSMPLVAGDDSPPSPLMLTGILFLLVALALSAPALSVHPRPTRP